uniref:Mediator of RNA polymerase II transcription subunit 25 n=1 Tax=Macrostomum lignano TaxID=282301 RepID=A0A1I8F4B5_9PLAT
NIADIIIAVGGLETWSQRRDVPSQPDQLPQPRFVSFKTRPKFEKFATSFYLAYSAKPTAGCGWLVRLATEDANLVSKAEYKPLWNLARCSNRVAEVVANQQEASATAAGLQQQQRRGSLGTAATASGTGRNAGQQSSSQQGTSFSPEEMSSCIRQAAQDIQSLTGTSSAGRATWAEPRSVASAAAAAATSSRNADDYQQLMMQAAAAATAKSAVWRSASSRYCSRAVRRQESA